MDKANFLDQSTSLALVITVSLIFALIGLVYSKKYQGINNYLTASRNVKFFSLSTSLVASALGAWILFGPASAATWGGVGAVIGYALGTAFPMIALIFLGKKLGITKYHKNTCLCEILGQLEHYWAQNAHFRPFLAYFGHISVNFRSKSAKNRSKIAKNDKIFIFFQNFRK